MKVTSFCKKSSTSKAPEPDFMARALAPAASVTPMTILESMMASAVLLTDNTSRSQRGVFLR